MNTEAAAQALTLPIRTVTLARPLHWLALGWRDLRRCPLPGLLHGLAVAVVGAFLLTFAHAQFWWLAGAFSGFLLLGPLVATGLYAISRELNAGRRAGLRTAVAAWVPQDARLVAFGALLALAGTGWVLTSASLVIALAPAPVAKPLDFIQVVVLNPHSWLFEIWLALGGLLAAPVYASSVLAIPMLQDRPISLFGAVLTSWRAVLANPVPMALWAAILMGLALLGMATALLGLVVVVPWLAHASWHAYRDLCPSEKL